MDFNLKFAFGIPSLWNIDKFHTEKVLDPSVLEGEEDTAITFIQPTNYGPFAENKTVYILLYTPICILLYNEIAVSLL